MTIANFLKKLQLTKLLTSLVLGVVLLLTTACNSGDAMGARPENPPVQLGGQNNPHKGGGDDYTQYKVPTDPQLDKDRASLLQPLETAIAIDTPDKTDEGLLYPNTTSAKSLNSDKDFISSERREKLLDPTQIPAPQQRPQIDRSDPDARLLEKTGQMFDDAAEFLPDLDEAAN